MKITQVETIELRRSTSVHWGVVGWLWVRVHTDEGIIGLGETCPASAVEKAVVLNDLAPRMIGRDPRDIPNLASSGRRACEGLRVSRSRRRGQRAQRIPCLLAVGKGEET